MKKYRLISNHLIKKEIQERQEKTCCFCGKKSKKYEKLKKIIGANFNNHDMIVGCSDCICQDCISLLDSKSFNGKAIRSYSLLATSQYLKILQKNEIIDVMLDNKIENDFVLSVTFASKKHWFFFSEVNNKSNDNFFIATDIGKININRKEFKHIYDICLDLYNNGFSKTEMSNCQSSKFAKIEKYGEEKFFKNMDVLKKYQTTKFLKLLLHLL